MSGVLDELLTTLLGGAADPGALARDLFARVGLAERLEVLAAHLDRAPSALLDRLAEQLAVPGETTARLAGCRLLTRLGRGAAAAAIYQTLLADESCEPEEAVAGYLEALRSGGADGAALLGVALDHDAGPAALAAAIDLADLPLTALEAALDDTDSGRRGRALTICLAHLRSRPIAEQRAVLGRHLDPLPQLLDPLIELARAEHDWEALLTLARRGLTLREDRQRYNALAAHALEQLGRPLP